MIDTQKANEIAKLIAKQGEHTLIIGTPGSGSTMVARRVADHLGYGTHEQQTADLAARHQIRRVLGLAPTSQLERPFRAPHHTISPLTLTGRRPDPLTWCPEYGELTLAHTGVLFLDEAPEFARAALEHVAGAARDGGVTHGTQIGNVTYPARFLLIVHKHPCPCGYHGGGGRRCQCSKEATRRYNQRLDPLIEQLTHTVDMRLI